MSGICGMVFREPGARLAPDCLSSPMRGLEAPGGAEGGTVHLGHGAMGAMGFVGRTAGVATLDAGGSRVAIAFHGNHYDGAKRPSPAEGTARWLEELLRRYVEIGPAVLRELRGEFALAVWDGRDGSLVLSTDRFRVHPLFYYRDAEKLVFASRMRSLRAAPVSLGLTLDPEAVVQIVGNSIVPTPGTIFREVKKLPPAFHLVYRRGEVSLAPYWEIDFRQPARGREAELAGELRSRFSDAMAVRLRSEDSTDRVGTYLSGGIDSSTVTGVMTRLTGGPVRSFSIGFDVPKFDELGFAHIAASAFSARHHEHVVTPPDVHEALPVIVEAFDEPFANASAVPAYYCAKLAREHGVDAMYAGDGGDELFAGNERYATQRLFEYYSRLPRWPRERLLRPLVFGLAGVVRGGPFVAAKKYVVRASPPYHERLSSYGVFKEMPMEEVFEDGFLDAVGRGYDPYAPEKEQFLRALAHHPLDRHLYLDLKITVSDNDILKVTRTAEAAGVAVRYPFLDHLLAEFAASVPAEIKMRGRRLRTFFKGAYADLLPAETRTKTKHGFGLPVHVWLREYAPLNEMMHDLVLSERSRQRGYFREKALRAIVERHRTDPTSFYGTLLWNLMMLELWHRAHWR